MPFTGPLRARPSKDRHEFQRNHPPAAPPTAYDRTGGTLTPAPAPGSAWPRAVPGGPRSPGAVPGRARAGGGRCPAARARPRFPPCPPRGGGAAATWERRARRRRREAPPGGGHCGGGRPRAPRTRRGRGRFRGQTHEPEAAAAVGASGPNPARADLCGRRAGGGGGKGLSPADGGTRAGSARPAPPQRRREQRTKSPPPARPRAAGSQGRGRPRASRAPPPPLGLPLPVPPPPAGAALPARRGVRGAASVPASGGSGTYLCSARGHGSPGAAGAAGAAAAGARASPPLFVCEGPRAALSRDVTGPCVISAQGHRAPTRRGQRHPPPRGRGRGGRERGWGGERPAPPPSLCSPPPALPGAATGNARGSHWRPRAPPPPRRARPAAHSVPRGQRPRRWGGRAPAPRHALPGTPRPRVGPPPLRDTAPRDGTGDGDRRGRGALAAGGRRRMENAVPPAALPGPAAPRRLAWTRRPRAPQSQVAGRARARAGEAAGGRVPTAGGGEHVAARGHTVPHLPRAPSLHPPAHSRPAAARLRQNRGDPGHPRQGCRAPAGPAEGPTGSSQDPGRGRTGCGSRKSVPEPACPWVTPGQPCGRSWGTHRELLAHAGYDTRTQPRPGPGGSGPRRCPELAAPVGALPARLYVTLTRVSVLSAE
ncbi:collagen alpha-1(I) chain-like [Corvus moneduloides]|uniref:collagen alpha-1(I) chain-like n=1 Tax=Corvus moneduloides TaxID=1196302 RepID=UPI001363EC13|nr:collagen alpha-1(I) chain-like [Corvus moneduloides]